MTAIATFWEWLFTPMPYGIIIGAILRLLLGFFALILADRYKRDGECDRALLARLFGFWTVLGGVSIQDNPNAPMTPYTLVWLLLLSALFGYIILRRAKEAGEGLDA